MGDRYYNQMLKTTGGAPGYKGKRKRRMAWTDEKKEEVIAAYEAADPTPENSMEIVKQIAEDFEESPNGVRIILSQAGVYVKKAAAASAKKNGSTGGGGTRVSKAAAQDSLTKALQDAGQEVDEDIVSRLTGKAAVYFTQVINAISG